MKDGVPNLAGWFALLCILAIAASALAQGAVGRGRQLAQDYGCLSCHAPDQEAKDPRAPYIAGQKIYYLNKQIEAFRRPQRSVPTGPYKVNERRHSFMSDQAMMLSDVDIASLAEYFSTLSCVPRRAVSPAVKAPEKARRCAYCHGETGVTLINIVPTLGGQKKDYLVAQLLALRESSLHSDSAMALERFDRMMAPSVYDLTDGEIDELATYFSSQSCK